MADLDYLRKEIDRIDRSIIEALRERFLVVSKIGKIKKVQHQPSLDSTRWQKVLTSRLAWAEELGVNKDFVKKVWNLIHDQSLKIEDHE